MKKIRVLLAGIGGYGDIYINELLHNPDPAIEIAGIADPFAERSPWYGEIKARNIPLFKSPEVFYQNHKTPGADLAVIASPIHTHYGYIATALNNGSNVLCEKPVCADLRQIDTLIAKERETGLFVAIGYQLCFARHVLALKEDILQGIFGRPRRFKAMCLPRRGTRYYRRNGWAGKRQFEGEPILDSPLNNACAHEVMNMLFLLGRNQVSAADVRSVQAELWRARPDIENYDAAAVRIRTEGDTELLFFTAHCIEEKQIGPLGEYVFERGIIRRGENSKDDFTAYFYDGQIKTYRPAPEEKRLQKLYDALESIRSGSPPVCTLETARPHLQCVLMAQEFPIQVMPEEKLVLGGKDTEDPYYYVPGLAQSFSRCYEEYRLPSEGGVLF
ncbi:MAG: Gfo/Idh/MocA family oxidoreductase [Treponema sp.]|jgi:predicted dehydrogenase|nr:Gfo/Idh/MocA family oxidoreductase [Treponema sp.]